MNTGYLKYFGVLLCLFAVAALLPPASAATWHHINDGVNVNGVNWTGNSTAPYDTFWKAGDGTDGGDPFWYHYAQPMPRITWENPLHLYYSKIAIWSYNTNLLWTCNGVTVNGLDTWVNVSISGSGSVTCKNDSVSTMYGGMREIIYENGTPPAPIANFTGAPLDSIAPAYISFTDTSENEYGGCTYNWSFTPTGGVLVAPQDLDNEDIVMLFTQNGNFTISHGVSCLAGSSIKTRSDYIHIFNSTATATFRVRAVDMLSGYGVNGAVVDVYDIGNTSWTNQTSVTGEVTVTAINGHTVNAYGSATGYTDADSLGLPAVAGALYPIYMWPSGFANNVSAGNITAYITVMEEGTNTRLAGMDVSISKGGGGAEYHAGQTNDNGVFSMTVKNQTNYLVHIPPNKGYLGASKSFNSGTQSGGSAYVDVEIWVGKNSVTTGPVVTTLPGGGTPVPTITYLAHCNPSLSDYDQGKCQQSESNGMMDQLYEAGPSLIGLCIVAIIFGLLRMIMG